jgi:hypothetical protein
VSNGFYTGTNALCSRLLLMDSKTVGNPLVFRYIEKQPVAISKKIKTVKPEKKNGTVN